MRERELQNEREREKEGRESVREEKIHSSKLDRSRGR